MVHVQQGDARQLARPPARRCGASPGRRPAAAGRAARPSDRSSAVTTCASASTAATTTSAPARAVGSRAMATVRHRDPRGHGPGQAVRPGPPCGWPPAPRPDAGPGTATPAPPAPPNPSPRPPPPPRSHRPARRVAGLGQLHRGVRERGRPAGDGGLRAHALAGPQGVAEELGEDGTGHPLVLGPLPGPAHLSQHLALAEHRRLQPRGHREQVDRHRRRRTARWRAPPARRPRRPPSRPGSRGSRGRRRGTGRPPRTPRCASRWRGPRTQRGWPGRAACRAPCPARRRPR